jgi:hypothetical protein
MVIMIDLLAVFARLGRDAMNHTVLLNRREA